MRTGVFLYLLAVLEFNFLDSSNLIGESANLPPYRLYRPLFVKQLNNTYMALQNS